MNSSFYIGKSSVLLMFTLILFLNVAPACLSAQVFCDGISLENVTIDFGETANIFDFPDIGAGDIVNGNSPTTGPIDFDIFDGIGMGQDGVTDLSISMALLPTNDIYGGLVLESSSTTQQVQQSESGLQGSMAHGTSGATNSTTGDVRCYQIELHFAVGIQIAAADFNVLLNSVNTAGQAFESSSIIFFDEAGLPYGTSSYNGFYSNPPTGTAGPGSNPPTISTMPWTNSGTGVYIADNTGTVDVSDPFNPVGGISGPADNADPNAAIDAGLLATDLVGGFLYTVCLEDVAATANDGDITSSQTSFTSTLQGLLLGEICFGNLILLAAELVDFNVKNEACRSLLSWKTLSETNLKHFEVQRSTDGITYRTIGLLAAQGNSTDPVQYDFEDPNPLQSSYYRLMMVDEDGSTEYSDILSFESTCRNGFHLTNLYPNPANGSLSIEFYADQDRQWQFLVTDMLGRNLLVKKYDSVQGFNQLSLVTGSLSTGTYLLRIWSDGRQVVRKFIVAN